MPRLYLDTLGGDCSPKAFLDGACAALPHLRGELILLGDRSYLEAQIQSVRRLRPLAEALQSDTSGATALCRVKIEHAPESITMEESIYAVRSKPEASINFGCKKVAEDWKARGTQTGSMSSALISAGHSGAIMASALLHLGRLEGVDRPAIAAQIPNLSPEGCVLLDVGANVDCTPENLRDFAIMGAVFRQGTSTQQKLPRVGLFSNGEERNKGNTVTRQALSLIESHPGFSSSETAIGRFMGNVEGKDLFQGRVDVIVTDGFVGNVVLKSLEGLGSTMLSLIKRESRKNPLHLLGTLLSRGAFRRLKCTLDYAEYGTAPLLGVGGYVFICHGRSNAKAIKNALIRTQTALNSRFVERLEAALGHVTASPPVASS